MRPLQIEVWSDETINSWPHWLVQNQGALIGVVLWHAVCSELVPFNFLYVQTGRQKSTDTIDNRWLQPSGQTFLLFTHQQHIGSLEAPSRGWPLYRNFSEMEKVGQPIRILNKN